MRRAAMAWDVPDAQPAETLERRAHRHRAGECERVSAADRARGPRAVRLHVRNRYQTLM